jgi:hypothetical protein
VFVGVRAAELSWLVARPTGVCPAERPAGIQRSDTVAAVGTARTPALASVGGPHPACGVHPSGFVVRGPAVRPSGVHPSSVHCLVSTRPASTVWRPPVQPSGVQPVRCPTRPVSNPSGVQPVRCPTRPVSAPRRSGRVRLLPPMAVAFGTKSRRRGDRHHRNGSRSLWLPRRRAARSTAQEAWGRATLPRSRWSVGVGGRTRAGLGAGGGRVTAERPGRPGRRAERPWLAAALWAREEAAARGGCTCRVAADPCWVRDHGAWWSWSLPPGWAGLEGPMGRVDGDGVRPRRGPGWQRALPARCRQRCDLREWVVGLPGLEPGTSSLSAKCR